MRSILILLSLIFVPLTAETVEPSINAETAALIHELTDISKDSKQFVVSEAPAVAQEILVKPWLALMFFTLGFLVSLALMLTGTWLFRKYKSKLNLEADDFTTLWCVFSVVGLLIIASVLFVNACISAIDWFFRMKPFGK